MIRCGPVSFFIFSFFSLFLHLFISMLNFFFFFEFYFFALQVKLGSRACVSCLASVSLRNLFIFIFFSLLFYHREKNIEEDI